MKVMKSVKMLETTVRITCEPIEAGVIYKTLKPEETETDRVKTRIERIKNVIVINIIARDPVALRSVLNSYLRILSAIADVEEVVMNDRIRTRTTD